MNQASKTLKPFVAEATDMTDRTLEEGEADIDGKFQDGTLFVSNS